MTTTNQKKAPRKRVKKVKKVKKEKANDSVSTDVRTKLLAIEKEVCSAILEREDAVRGLLLALLTRQHILLLGPPGTAKSMVTDMAQHVIEGAERFSLLLTKTTMPDELFGMWDISKIDQGEFERIDAGGTLRTAQIAFLDEVFKCNSASLNALLGILNERKFRNGTSGEVSVPLVSAVGASNEYPQSDNLGALYDRFLLRYWIQYLGEDGNWVDLLLSGARPEPTTTVTLDDLERAQAEVAAVEMPKALASALLLVRSKLASVGIQASDRRWFQAMKIVRAQAWLDGRDSVETEDLLVLQHVLWNNHQDEARKVTETLLDICAPKLKDLLNLMDLAHEQVRMLRDYTRRDDVTRGEISEAKSKFTDLADEVKKLAPDAGPRGREQVERLESLEDEAAQLHAQAAWGGGEF